MCGICGFVTTRRIERDALHRMNTQMVHRGPDDEGVGMYEMGERLVGLAHRRLSILDLSQAGHQPMTSQGGDVVVVFNGEIYNFKAIRKELTDYRFRSNSDTEVILAAYLKWGISFLEKLNGMFALALLDRRKETLYLIRDRIGKKPLYYYYRDEELVFASELKPIMEYPGLELEIDKTVLSRYLYMQYINAPDSVFEHVYKLEPGSLLQFSDGKIEKKKYWDVATVHTKFKAQRIVTFNEAKEGLRAKIHEAVRTRLLASDVAVGTFLSGGFDSTLVTAMAQEISEKAVKTFTIGIEDPKFNEAKYAKEVAAHLGTEHTELYITERDLSALVPDIATYYDEPFADSSQIPSMLVSKLAKQDVTVILSGDGGDEFFCGYKSHIRARQAQLLDIPGGIAHWLFSTLGAEEKLPISARALLQNRDLACKTQLYSAYDWELVKELTGRTNPRDAILYPVEHRYQETNWQTRSMLLDMDTYLPGDILCKVDRAAMRYSLETRCPLLDKEVMEYSYRIPQKFKCYKNTQMYILKELVYDYVPKAIMDRPKHGFSIPIEQWLKGPLREELLSYAEYDFVKNQGLFCPEAVQKNLQEFLNYEAEKMTHAAGIWWAFFAFQQWYMKYRR